MDYFIKDSEDGGNLLELNFMTPAGISDEVLDKAKKLLNSYKNVLWSIKSNVNDLEEECQLVMKEDLEDVIDILDKYDYRMDKRAMDDKLRASLEVRLMEKMIVIAMQKVKDYPQVGFVYYEVLRQNYLLQQGNKEAVIIEQMNIARSTYYKYKKEAIKVFGFCLWYIILPNMKSARKKTSHGVSIPCYGAVYSGA